jgi:hypothetical protein
VAHQRPLPGPSLRAGDQILTGPRSQCRANQQSIEQAKAATEYLTLVIRRIPARRQMLIAESTAGRLSAMATAVTTLSRKKYLSHASWRRGRDRRLRVAKKRIEKKQTETNETIQSESSKYQGREDSIRVKPIGDSW